MSILIGDLKTRVTEGLNARDHAILNKRVHPAGVAGLERRGAAHRHIEIATTINGFQDLKGRDAAVDAALDAGRQAESEEARAEAYSALNARLMEIAPTIYGFDRQSVFAASNRVNVPALSDPAMAFGLDGMGFSFRLMEMTE